MRSKQSETQRVSQMRSLCLFHHLPCLAFFLNSPSAQGKKIAVCFPKTLQRDKLILSWALLLWCLSLPFCASCSVSCGNYKVHFNPSLPEASSIFLSYKEAPLVCNPTGTQDLYTTVKSSVCQPSAAFKWNI